LKLRESALAEAEAAAAAPEQLFCVGKKKLVIRGTCVMKLARII
jgi:hypothetical protein